ncbi:hypothetical protein DRO54_02650 [Candidatus Bathyarchaeota archaeon]|nr:MAG: hypothetical protein DRO54_02650 [Candidatus Bathyarchaeota archaeon]
MGIIKDMKEILKSLKHRSALKPSIKYCPRCGSSKLKTKINWFIVPSQTYKCPECGYEGPIFMEKEQNKCKKV